MSDFQKIMFGGTGVIALTVLLVYFSGCSSFDFSKTRFSFSSSMVSDSAADKGKGKGKKTEEDKRVSAEEAREKVVTERRASVYVESATRDYYNGSYEEALRRLDRAKQYNPCSYEALRLSGQILYEMNYYRKAFNDWSRAVELPNEDHSVSRDLDVVKRLVRYGRNEMDRLQMTLHRHPEDRIAYEKLQELRIKMQE